MGWDGMEAKETNKQRDKKREEKTKRKRNGGRNKERETHRKLFWCYTLPPHPFVLSLLSYPQTAFLFRPQAFLSAPSSRFLARSLRTSRQRLTSRSSSLSTASPIKAVPGWGRSSSQVRSSSLPLLLSWGFFLLCFFLLFLLYYLFFFYFFFLVCCFFAGYRTITCS